MQVTARNPKSTNHGKERQSLRCVHSLKPAAHAYHRRRHHHQLAEACCRTVTSAHTIGKNGERRETRDGTDTRVAIFSLDPRHYKRNSRRPSRHGAPPAGAAGQRTTTNSVCGRLVLTPRTKNAIGAHGQTHTRTHAHAHAHTHIQIHTHAHTPPSSATHARHALCHEPWAGGQRGRAVERQREGRQAKSQK